MMKNGLGGWLILLAGATSLVGCSASTDSEELGSDQAALDATTCVEATQALELKDRVVVTANASTGALTMGADSRLIGNGDVAGNADLRNRAKVSGTLQVHGTVKKTPDVVIGTLVNPATVTVPPLPVKVLTVGTGTVNVNATTTLNPGNFGATFINGGTITLNPGTYNFASLTINAGVTLNLSATVATVINVQGAINLNQVRYNATVPTLVSWYSNASITVNSSQTPALPGSLLAPNGAVNVGPRNTINGCVQGRTVSIDVDSHVNGH